MCVGAELVGLTRKCSLFFGLIIIILALTLISLTLYDWWQDKRYQQLAQNAVIKPVKVFQIGFSKCATTTIAEFFIDNGVATIHHDFGHLAASIYNNAQAKQPLISPQYANYYVFTDMERMYEDPPINIPLTYFKELDKQYPGSKFILNTRDKQAWLKSRANHHVGSQKGPTLIELNAKILNLSPNEVLSIWSQEWDEHHIAVIEYFKDRPNDLLVFNIDIDTPELISEFLKDYFILDANKYTHKNKTSVKQNIIDEKVEQVEFFSQKS